MNALLLLTVALVQTPSGADAHFAKVQAVAQPPFDAQRYETEKDAYVEEYEKAIKSADVERNKLILEFYKAHPEDSRLPDLMVRRWTSMHNGGNKPEDTLKEIDAAAKAAKNEPMKASAEYARIVVGSSLEGFDWSKAVGNFRSKHKSSKYYEQIIVRASFEVPQAQKRGLIELFIKDFPDHRFVSTMKGQLRQMDGVGKPFKIAFDDAINGKKVDIADFKGKVVMIDFWATWCGPCIAELPKVKELYKKYKDQGFEIIGVSLDQPEAQGGLAALKEFVSKNDMPWPQYYQGNGWDSEFSSSWGVMSIPNIFLVDREGILREVEVANLEESLKRLLN